MSIVLICLIASDLYAMIPLLTPVSFQKICRFTRFVINCRFVNTPLNQRRKKTGRKIDIPIISARCTSFGISQVCGA